MSRRRTWIAVITAASAAVAAGASAAYLAGGARLPNVLAGRGVSDVRVSDPATSPDNPRGAAAAASGPRFTDVTAASGIDYTHWRLGALPTGPLYDVPFQTGGAAAGDFDGDGWTDLFVTRYDNPPILYRNRGDGTFADVTPTTLQVTLAGVPVATNGAAWGDVDNDGHLDLFVQAVDHPRHFLFINHGNGRFTEEARARGASHDYGNTRFGVSPSFGDYDGDGYLDLLTTEWGFEEIGVRGTRLHRNLGAAKPGYFADVTEPAGVVRTNMTRPLSFAPRFTDLDRDGKTDIAIAGDYGSSQLFWNKGDGTFHNGTVRAGVNTGTNEMGSAFGDFDGDGDLDWFLSSVRGNRLYRNLGDRKFAEVSEPAGVRQGSWGWGATFVDLDNDADLDLIHTNGMFYLDRDFVIDQTRVFLNAGDGTFAEQATALGVNDAENGRGLLTFDYDNDGDLDLFIVNAGSNPILYRNDGGNANPWLKVKTIGGAGSGVPGASTNRDGFGAWITVADANLPHVLVWETNGGSNFLGQNDPVAFFGLGPKFSGTVDLVIVQWPGGARQEFRDVAPNQLLSAREVDAVPGRGGATGGGHVPGDVRLRVPVRPK